MGFPLSPIIADITLQDSENKALAALPMIFPFYVRYVDDIALAAPSSLLKLVLNTFNSFHPRLQFTMEEGIDNQLNFLDVTIIVNNNVVEFDWFHKSIFSGRYLNFESRHPLYHKRGTTIGLIDKVFWLSHPRFHQKNLEFIIKILLNNEYPLNFIIKTMKERLKFLFEKSIQKQELNINIEDTEKVSYFNIKMVTAIRAKRRIQRRE